MKPDIHPKYFTDARVVCSCGNSWTTGSTSEELRTDLCNVCHPFYTGEQRIVDSEGQVERFRKKVDKHIQYVEKQQETETAVVSPELLLNELKIGARALAALQASGISTAGDVLESLLAGGDKALLDVTGFGRKGLIDLKKGLRSRGFEL